MSSGRGDASLAILNLQYLKAGAGTIAQNPAGYLP